MRRLHTDFRGGDLSGRCRYPLELEYVPQRKICVICEICVTKKSPQRKICVYLWNLRDKIIHTKKNLCHLWNLWDEIIHTKKNLRHLRNLRDKKQQEHISGASHWPAVKVPRKSVSNPISKNAFRFIREIRWRKIQWRKIRWRKSVIICEICGTKNSHEEKSASSAKSAWQKQ